MHDYSIDRSPRVKILFFLSAIAIFLAPKINSWLFNGLEWFRAWSGSTRAIAVAIPTFVLFSALYLAVDRWLWRYRVIRRLLLVPDLNGTWQCEGRTTLRRGEKAEFDWAAKINIVQSWSKISIHLQTSQSSSSSTTASVQSHAHGYRLNYTYKNNPRPGEPELSVHDGIAEIEFDPDCIKGSGHYFTDQHRQTSGKMHWKKV
jgi:hypothetical protein